MGVVSSLDLKPSKKLDPIAFEELIDLEINKPGRYMGHALGVKPRDWNAADKILRSVAQT